MEKGECTGKISELQKEIENIENNMRRREAANEENRKWRARLEVAEALYAKMKKEFEQKERKTFLELNKMCSLILKRCSLRKIKRSS